jgi:sulfatase maturation enzyme AslB (radical SAM superfamily)
MFVSFNPWYYCNFRCDFCYLTKEQLSDKKLLELNIFEKKLIEIQSYKKIDHIDFYGGEVALLPKNYFFEFKDICKKINPEINLNIITNLSILNEITTDNDCYTSVSYDFDCREKDEIVWKNMTLMTKPFSILMLAGEKLIEKNVDEMIMTLNLLSKLESVEIKPYSSNQSNQQKVTYSNFEEFIKKWIKSNIEKKFDFVNEDNIKDSLNKTRTSFSDDHVYITPSGKFAVLEFDLNDNEFFLEYDNIEKYFEWSKIEKEKVSKNKFCSTCKYFGNCLSEHLRDVKSLENSCNGFKYLIEWYENEK